MVVSELIGKFGKYHYWLCFIVFLSRFGVAFQQMAIIFLAPPAQYYCEDPSTECCTNPVFNTSLFKRTIITEWNLTCAKSWLKDFNQTMFQFGVLVGSVLFGMASDKYGRRPALITSVIIEIAAGVTSSFLPDYWSFTIGRMVLGLAVGGIMVITFVIVMEFIGNDLRDVVSTVFHIPFTAGHVLLAAFGYFVRDYKYFQFSISIGNTILLCYICLLPETPRWLLAVKKTDEAVDLIERIAKINNLPTEDIRFKIEEYQTEHKAEKAKSSVLDLFRTPNLRKNILLMSYIWLSCSYCFYGMVHYISHLTGNIFINVAATGSVCLCGCIMAVPLIKFTNRKTVVILMNSLCCLGLMIVAFIPEGTASIVFGCAGVMCCYVVFIIVYLYCSEMFPTVVRNAALGICSMMARVGAMLAPYVVDLRQYGQWCAPLAFGVFPIMAALLCLFLPETKDCELLMTLEEGEQFTGKRRNLQTTNVSGKTASLNT